MDVYEATRIVLSRIQSLDPENASKIMGLLLIQDHGEKEMIRLAFGPESLLHSVIFKARKDLGLPLSANLPANSPSTPSTPLSPSPFSVSFSRQSSSCSSVSSRILASRNSGAGGINLPPSLTIPNPSSAQATWSNFSDLQNKSLDDLMSPNNGINIGSSFSSILNSSSLPFYGGESINEFQLQDQLNFLNDGADSMPFPRNWGGGPVHHRSCSVNDACLGSADPASGFGWKPCLYYARGYCKNGTSCRFLHEGLGDLPLAAMAGSDGAPVTSSSHKLEMMDQCHELLRSKSAHQHRLAAASFPYSPKSINYLLQQNDSPRGAAALMMNDDVKKFNLSRPERSDFLMNGGSGMLNPASRQIYLTFPADSTFREEDVSIYFSIYGPVQDVRIPYQQKRMFGFVTFMYPETVKLILAKGNPHFVCDARVLVKPYKEKGKVPDKLRKQQQMERGEFSPCNSPNSFDSRDPFDLQLGGRMFYNNPDMLWRKKLEEQVDLQQALGLQGRRLMGLQLLDVKQHHRALSTGSPIPSLAPSPVFHKSLSLPFRPDSTHEKCSSPARAGSMSSTGAANITDEENNGNGEECPIEDRDLQECFEHNLPDSPFASPAKGNRDFISAISTLTNAEDLTLVSSTHADSSVAQSLLPPDMAAFTSFNFQIPRFSSGHGAIGIYAGTGGPTCPVGI